MPTSRSRRPRVAVALSLAAGACLLVIALVLVSLRGRAPRTGPLGLGCRFTEGAQLAFRLQTILRTGLRTGLHTGEAVQSLRGRLYLRALAHEDTGWLLAGALTDVAAGSGYEAAASAPFLLRMSGDCRFADFGFLPAMKPEGRQQIRGLFQSMEVLLPAQPGASGWMRAHKDQHGTYTALYSTEAPDPKDPHPRLRKRRGPYTSLRGASGMEVALLRAEASAVLDRDGAWLRAYDGEEHLRLSQEGKPLLDLRAEVSLRRDDAPFPVAVPEVAAFAFGEAALAEGPRQAPPLPPVDERLLGRLRGQDLRAALAAFLDRLRMGDDRAIKDAASALAAYLRARPEAAAELLGRLRRGDLPDEAQAAAFLALEIAGTPQAEAALAEALLDPGMRAMNRMRAAAALQDVPSPSERGISALTRAAAARPAARDEEGDNVRRTALLALGTLSSRLEGERPAEARQLRDEIGRQLRGARGALPGEDQGDLTAALDAIGNSGDESFAAELKALAGHQATIVRGHAARAYRRMDPAVRDPALAGWLPREEDPAVRQAIAETLLDAAREAGRAPDPAIPMAIARLPQEPSPQVRALLIQILGAAKDVPAAKAALIAHFHREQVPELLALIGRYCTVEELR
jgi:hypothetical protein